MARSDTEARLEALDDLYASIVELDTLVTEAEARDARMKSGETQSLADVAERFPAFRADGMVGGR
jgi:hypothetical protein